MYTSLTSTGEKALLDIGKGQVRSVMSTKGKVGYSEIMNL